MFFFYEIKKKGLMYYERGQRLVECVTNNFKKNYLEFIMH